MPRQGPPLGGGKADGGRYIDVATTWDAYSQAKEAVRVIIAIAKKEDPKCGPDGCLAKGRVVTPATVKSIPNLWSGDYK